MGVYRLSSKAEIDLAELYEFGVYKFGLLQAQKYFLQMHDVFQVLGENPNLGRDASVFIENLKRGTYEAHTIFYLQVTNGLFIVRVLSQRMDDERNRNIV